MSNRQPESVTAYKRQVRRAADSLRGTWVEQLRGGLDGTATGEAYWINLTAMAILDFRNTDEEVQQALTAGLRRWEQEKNLAAQGELTAGYLLANPTGDFLPFYVHRLDGGSTADVGITPQRLLQTHIDLLEKKRTLLYRINDFVAVYNGKPQRHQVADNQAVQNADSLVGQLDDQLRSLRILFTTLTTTNATLQRVRRMHTSRPAWNELLEQLQPPDETLGGHLATKRMLEKVKEEKKQREKLEQAREKIVAVQHDDSHEAIKDALEAIDLLRRLDPHDEYRVLDPLAGGSPANYEREITLEWRGLTLSLPSLEEVRETLGQIRQEQETISDLCAEIDRRVGLLVGPLLAPRPDIEDPWPQIMARGNLSMRVDLLWSWIVQCQTDELGSRLGEDSEATMLEKARRRGRFSYINKDNMLEPLDVLLPQARPGDKPPDGDDADTARRFSAWSEYVRARWEMWSLRHLEHLVNSLLKFPGARITGQGAKTAQDVSAELRALTLSRASYNLLAGLATFSARLAVVVRWAQDYRDNQAFWERERNRWVEIIENGDPGEAREYARGQLQRFCGEHPSCKKGHLMQKPPMVMS